MNRHGISIDGQSYQGPFDFAITELDSRPSQPGDGRPNLAEFQVHGPAFNSVEDISTGEGFLGVCGAINVDTRWRNQAVLGPLVNEIDLSSYDHAHAAPILGVRPLGTTFILGGPPQVQNANGQVSVRANAKRYFYIIRGNVPAKVQADDRTLKRANIDFDAPAKDIVLTRAEDATADQEVSVALGESRDYKVLQFGDIGNGLSGDIWKANDEGRGADVFGISPTRVVALEDDSIYGNILTGTGGSRTTMYEPSWGTVDTISGYDFEFTDFITDGNLWIIGTSIGPFVYDSGLSEFFPLFPDLDNDPENCRAMIMTPQMGVIFGMRDGAYSLSGTTGQAWGVETFTANTCEIQGYPTAHAASTHRIWQIVYNPSNGHSYLIEWLRRQYGDPHPGHEFVPYPLAKFTSKQSRYLSYIGRLSGTYDHPTLMGGYGSNSFWIEWGETARDIDDEHYDYAASGTLALTELRRNPSVLKDIEAVEFTTDDCSNTETVTVSLTVDGVAKASVGLKEVTTDGMQRQNVKALDGEPNISGRYIKPSIALTRGSTTTTSPIIQGPLRLYYRERPEMLRIVQFPLELTGRPGIRTSQDELDSLKALENGEPVELEGLPITWGKVESVQAQDTVDRGGGETRARGDIKRVLVTVAGWS